MKKKILIAMTLLITCGGLTGCGASDEDLKCAENPDKCVKDIYKSSKQKEIELINEEEKTDDTDNVTTILKYKLKDDENIVFDTCAYWDSSVVGVSEYNVQDNYQEVYTEVLLKNHFDNSNKFVLNFESKSRYVNKICTLEYNTPIIELIDLNDISELYNELLEVKEEKEIFSVSVDVKYQDKKVSISLNDNVSNEDVHNKLEELKNV